MKGGYLLLLIGALLKSTSAYMALFQLDCKINNQNGILKDSTINTFNINELCENEAAVQFMNQSGSLGTISSQEVNILVSSLGPYYNVSELTEGNSFVVRVGSPIQIPLDTSSLSLKLPNSEITFPSNLCGVYFLIVTLLVDGSERSFYSTKNVPIYKTCKDENVDGFNLMLEVNQLSENAKIILKKNQTVMANGIEIKLKNNGTVAVSERTFLSTFEVVPLTAPRGFFPDQIQNMIDEKYSISNISKKLINEIDEQYFWDRIYQFSPMKGFETILAVDNEKGFNLQPGQEIILNLTKLIAPEKLMCFSRTGAVLVLEVNFLHSGVKDSNSDHALFLPVEYDCQEYINEFNKWNQLEDFSSCEVLPDVLNDGQSVTLLNIGPMIGQNIGFNYDDVNKGFQPLKNMETAYEKMEINQQVNEVTARLKKVEGNSDRECPQAILEESMQQKLQISPMKTLQMFYKKVHDNIDAIPTSDAKVTEDKRQMLLLLSLEDELAKTYLTGTKETHKHMVVFLVMKALKSMAKGLGPLGLAFTATDAIEFMVKLDKGMAGGEMGWGGDIGGGGMGGGGKGWNGGMGWHGGMGGGGMGWNGGMGWHGRMGGGGMGGHGMGESGMGGGGMSGGGMGGHGMGGGGMGGGGMGGHGMGESGMGGGGMGGGGMGGHEMGWNGGMGWFGGGMGGEGIGDGGINGGGMNGGGMAGGGMGGGGASNFSNLGEQGNYSNSGGYGNISSNGGHNNSINGMSENQTLYFPNEEKSNITKILSHILGQLSLLLQDIDGIENFFGLFDEPCNGFKCTDSEGCIDSNKECNGYPDCSDNSDEEGCNNSNESRKRRKRSSLLHENVVNPGHPYEDDVNPNLKLSPLQGETKDAKWIPSNQAHRKNWKSTRFNSNFMHRRRFRNNGRKNSNDNWHKNMIISEGQKTFLLKLFQAIKSDDLSDFEFLPASLTNKMKEVIAELEKNKRLLSLNFIIPWYKTISEMMRNVTFINSPFIKMLSNLKMKAMMVPHSPHVVLDVLRDFQSVYSYIKSNFSSIVKKRFEGNSTMNAHIEFSLALGDALNKSFDSLTEFMRMSLSEHMNSRSELSLLMRGNPGIEPTTKMMCKRAARQYVKGGIQILKEYYNQENKDDNESPMFSPLTMEDVKIPKLISEPIYWMKVDEAIYKGQRAMTLGALLWEKIAVCSCSTRRGNKGRAPKGRGKWHGSWNAHDSGKSYENNKENGYSWKNGDWNSQDESKESMNNWKDNYAGMDWDTRGFQGLWDSSFLTAGMKTNSKSISYLNTKDSSESMNENEFDDIYSTKPSETEWNLLDDSWGIGKEKNWETITNVTPQRLINALKTLSPDAREKVMIDIIGSNEETDPFINYIKNMNDENEPMIKTGIMQLLKEPDLYQKTENFLLSTEKSLLNDTPQTMSLNHQTSNNYQHIGTAVPDNAKITTEELLTTLQENVAAFKDLPDQYLKQYLGTSTIRKSGNKRRSGGNGNSANKIGLIKRWSTNNETDSQLKGIVAVEKKNLANRFSRDIGTVCPLDWGEDEATVVCSMILARKRFVKDVFLFEAVPLDSTHFDDSTPASQKLEFNLKIKLSGVKCSKNASDLIDDCQHHGWKNGSCSNNTVLAAVYCHFKKNETLENGEAEIFFPTQPGSHSNRMQPVVGEPVSSKKGKFESSTPYRSGRTLRTRVPRSSRLTELSTLKKNPSNKRELFY